MLTWNLRRLRTLLEGVPFFCIQRSCHLLISGYRNIDRLTRWPHLKLRIDLSLRITCSTKSPLFQNPILEIMSLQGANRLPILIRKLHKNSHLQLGGTRNHLKKFNLRKPLVYLATRKSFPSKLHQNLKERLPVTSHNIKPGGKELQI